jgi:hypothetical protein
VGSYTITAAAVPVLNRFSPSSSTRPVIPLQQTVEPTTQGWADEPCSVIATTDSSTGVLFAQINF